MQALATKNKSKSSLIKVLLGLLLVAAIVAAGIAVKVNDNSAKSTNTATTKTGSTISGTTSTPTKHEVPTTPDTPDGGITDNNGSTSTSLPPSSQWSTSTSGNVTLQQPVVNGTVVSGTELIGTAKVKTVSFILVDDNKGQIAQGSLDVVNGKFAGTLHFTAHDSTGKLQVFYSNPDNGAEQDLVEVNVQFGN